MDSPYLDLKEAAALGKYRSPGGLRRAMERGDYIKGVHYFNRGGKKKGAITFWRDKFMAAIEGKAEPETFEFRR